jgi:molybdopterin molybdotransferase
MAMNKKDMLGRSGLVTVEQARSLLYAGYDVPAPAHETVGITDALKRVLAVDVVSSVTLPAFARSSMDGYAVAARDTFGATDSMPAYLSLAGEIQMGEEALTPLVKGHACGISTGGMLPPGADAVVMLEHSQLLPDGTVEVLRPVAPGESVVQPGEDVKAGDVLLTAGHRIRPQDMGALAGVGVTTLRVCVRPKVAIINTGNEIVEASSEPAPGQVRDVNSYNLTGLVAQAGGLPQRMGIYRDEYAAIRGAVEAALDCSDVVAITGGSSVGTRDLTARVIGDLGPPGVLLHGVSVRPGKPVIIGVAGAKPVFGLPGHPVAVTVSFELFIRPLLKRLSGEVDPLGLSGIPPVRVVRARMARNYSSSPGREDHIRVALELRDGEHWARPILGKSGLITTLVRAHGSVVIPVERVGVSKGDWVDVELFD